MEDNTLESEINFDALPASANPSANPSASSGQATINADFAIFIMDAFIARTISVIAKFSGYEVKYSDLKLTKDEIKQIKPAAERALKKFIDWMNEKAPEYFMLFVSLAVIYGGKTMVLAKPIKRGAASSPNKKGAARETDEGSPTGKIRSKIRKK